MNEFLIGLATVFSISALVIALLAKKINKDTHERQRRMSAALERNEVGNKNTKQQA